MSFSILLRRPIKHNDLVVPVGGRLQKFLPLWANITKNPFVLDLIAQGYRIELLNLPPERYCITNLPKDTTKALAMKNLLGDLIKQGVVVPVPPEEDCQGFYSHIFLIKKPSGSFRSSSI